VWGIAFSGTRVVYIDGHIVVVLDTTTMKVIEAIEIGLIMYNLTVCEDGRTLLLVCEDDTGRVVDLQTKKSVILKGHTLLVLGIIECGDTDVLTCSWDETIRRWNRLTGELIRTYSGHSGAVYCILYDKKTNVMFSGSYDMRIIVWNVETGEKIGEMNGHRGLVLSLAYVNATTIVSGSSDYTVKVWDIPTMKEIKTMSSHTDVVRSVAVTPDGQYVVSGSWDKTVKVSSIATGECITTLSHHSNEVTKVAVSPNGRFIASGGQDKMFHLLSVTPPFSFIVHQGLLTLSSNVETDHRLFSDGRLLSTIGDANITLTRSTRCIQETEYQFRLENFEFMIDSSRSFTAMLSQIPQSVGVIVTRLFPYLFPYLFPQDHSTSSRSNNSNTIIRFSTTSASSTLNWIEAIYAVRDNITLHHTKQSHSPQQMIHRHRFDILQCINFHHNKCRKNLFLPKDITKIIADYAVKNRYSSTS
jgi:WD40 repeat protein